MNEKEPRPSNTDKEKTNPSHTDEKKPQSSRTIVKRRRPSDASDKKSANNKLKKALMITLIVLLALLLVIVTVPGALFIRYYNMLDVQRRDPDDSSIYYDVGALSALASNPETAPPDDPDNPYNTQIETKAPNITGTPNTNASDTEPPIVVPTRDLVKEKGVINILLVGADYETRYGNSDAIIIVSINDADKRLTLTSIMRDTEVYFPGIENGKTVTWRDKISNAHAYGGPKLLINAIENNFGIEIENYAEVHYNEFMKVIDTIGGIDIVMNAEEVREFNIECSQKIPADSAGKPVTLNAEQTLAYARMRHLSGDDFMRTYRHRNVLIAAFNKLKTMGIGQIDNLLSTLFPIIETDLSLSDCFSYAAGVANYARYSVETFRMPVDGYYTYERNNLCIRGYNKTVTLNMWREQVAGTR